ncbi:MAG: PD-(D/E)XK nuclease family protein [Treponema sp.]|nr:PD-(D/E)XK nuclease family protein [Treponema sp.]
MQAKKINPSQMSQIIAEQLNLNPESVFVFSSDVAANSWAEWCVKNPDESGVSAIATDQFIAWDNFKEKHLSVKQEGFHAVPSILRKIFVHNLLAEHKKNVLENNPLFKSIVPTDKELAKNSVAFTDWLAKNLPALDFWYKCNSINDEEDSDYELLYKRYSQFLQENKMFEQSWITPDFLAEDKSFVIFWPNIFEDYAEYKNILDNAPQITQFTMTSETEDSKPEGFFFADSRTELRKMALYIRDLHSKGVAWDQIALHVLDLDQIRPYVERELNLYCVPFITRAGVSFTTNAAGNIFEHIYECYTSNFSYDSVRTLVLNGYIPWKQIDKDGNPHDYCNQLITKGCELHTICSYQDEENGKLVQKDTWEESLKANNEWDLLNNFYYKIKNNIKKICKATSFEKIRQAWFIFKTELLDEDSFTQEADNILSRCVSCLSELIHIENDFEITKNIQNHYEFFLNELSQKKYTPQQKRGGINIYDYKVAACASYKYNVIINCNQKSATIVYKQFDFLTDTKRENLKEQLNTNSLNTDVSSAFLRLYAKSGNSVFFGAEETFSGFSIPHNFINLRENSALNYLDNDDFIKNEKELFLNGSQTQISDKQAEQFNNWKKAVSVSGKNSDENLTSLLQNQVDFVLKQNPYRCNAEKDCGENIVKITQTDLRYFFPCPRKWLYKSCLKLKEDSLETNLMGIYDMGTIFHKILELLFIQLAEISKSKPILPLYTEKTDEEKKELETFLKNTIDSLVEQALTSTQKDENNHTIGLGYQKTPLILKTLLAQKDVIIQTVFNFVIELCKKFGGYTIFSTEQELWKKINDNYALYGRLDTVLSDGNRIEGQMIPTAILDFKATKTKSANECKANEETGEIADFQMAEFVDLIQEKFDAQTFNITQASFASISKAEFSDIIVKEKSPRTSAVYIDEFQDTLLQFRKYTDYFYEQIKNLKFEPIVSSNIFRKLDTYSDCITCDYKSICRTTFTVAGKSLSFEKN